LLHLLAMPGWLRIGAGILLIDLADYWRHRITHELPLLWRIHRVHNTDPAMDVTTALRSHPLDIAMRMAAIVLIVPALGIPPISLLLSPVITLLVLLFMHANISLPQGIDRIIALLIQTPGLHRSHHSRFQRETDSNYGTILTVWDRLFGTLVRVETPAELRLGLAGWTAADHQTIAGMMVTPFQR
jgi:sterol desaturase/sphingolipid hydroxylase (fatty acid hydroxylase superfamily)